MTYHVHVRVMPRDGLLDPQGQAIEQALHELAFEGTSDVRVGRAIELQVAADSESEAQSLAQRMCEKLLANPVTEDFRIDVEPS